jgi:preprotein translocase subunit SecF
MQIFVNPNYNFVKWRVHATILSLVIIGIGLAVFLTRGLNPGIDFAGGASITLKFQQEVPLDQLRDILPAATIQQFGKAAENSVYVRLPNQQREGDYAGTVVADLHKRLNPEAASKLDLNFSGRDALAAILKQVDPDVKGSNVTAQQYYNALAERIIARRSDLGIFTQMSQASGVQGVTPATAKLLNERTFLGDFNLLNQETVGPQVGAELQQKAIWAVVLSSLAMAIYIAIRFEQGLIFGVAGLVCIIHDVLIAMAFLVIMRLEFSLNVVAALLTIVGYSVNDTVVMYDRVRENKRKSKTPMSLGEHLNKAINDTLSRTVLTAGSVFLVLLAMLIFGGEVIRGFSWILLIGVVSGTYSTLLIVPAVAVAWDNWNTKRRPVASVRTQVPPRRDVEPEPRARRRKVS